MLVQVTGDVKDAGEGQQAAAKIFRLAGTYRNPHDERHAYRSYAPRGRLEFLAFPS